MVIFGGVSERPQIDALRQGCDVLVATPGRLLDLVEQRALDLSGVRHLVLDEADRMLDMGFIHAIRTHPRRCCRRRGRTCCSPATYPDAIRELAPRHAAQPGGDRSGAAATPPHERVAQVAFRVSTGTQAAPARAPLPQRRHRRGAVVPGAGLHAHQARREPAGRASSRLPASVPRRSMATRARRRAVRALEDFKAGRVAALVATDSRRARHRHRRVAARRQLRAAERPEDYVHRIGRTGACRRHRPRGELVASDEAGLLRDIERTMRQPVPVLPTPQFEISEVSRPSASACPTEPLQLRHEQVAVVALDLDHAVSNRPAATAALLELLGARSSRADGATRQAGDPR
jgi:ATP-dependent RNA helicase RhlE